MDSLFRSWGMSPAWTGSLLALLASMIWACSITVYRHYSRHLSAGVLNLNKISVSLIAFGVVIYLTQATWPDDFATWFWLMVSGVIGLALGDTFFLLAIRSLGAGLTSALQNLTPPVAALIALIFMGEKMNRWEVLGLVITLAALTGIVLVGSNESSKSRMELRTYLIGVLFASLAAICQAIAMNFTSHYSKSLDPNILVFLRLLPSIPILLAMNSGQSEGRAGMKWLLTRPRHFTILALTSLAGTFLGLVLLTLSYKYTSTGVATTISNAYPIWIIPIAYLFLRERPKAMQIFWTVIALVGIGVMMWGGETPPGQ